MMLLQPSFLGPQEVARDSGGPWTRPQISQGGNESPWVIESSQTTWVELVSWGNSPMILNSSW